MERKTENYFNDFYFSHLNKNQLVRFEEIKLLYYLKKLYCFFELAYKWEIKTDISYLKYQEASKTLFVRHYLNLDNFEQLDNIYYQLTNSPIHINELISLKFILNIGWKKWGAMSNFITNHFGTNIDVYKIYQKRMKDNNYMKLTINSFFNKTTNGNYNFPFKEPIFSDTIKERDFLFGKTTVEILNNKLEYFFSYFDSQFKLDLNFVKLWKP